MHHQVENPMFVFVVWAAYLPRGTLRQPQTLFTNHSHSIKCISRGLISEIDFPDTICQSPRTNSLNNGERC